MSVLVVSVGYKGLSGGECSVQDTMYLHFDISIVHFNG